MLRHGAFHAFRDSLLVALRVVGQRKGKVAGCGALACGGVVAAASDPAVVASGLRVYAAQAVAKGVITLGCRGDDRETGHPARPESRRGKKVAASHTPCPKDLGLQIERREAAGNTDQDEDEDGEDDGDEDDDDCCCCCCCYC